MVVIVLLVGGVVVLFVGVVVAVAWTTSRTRNIICK